MPPTLIHQGNIMILSDGQHWNVLPRFHILGGNIGMDEWINASQQLTHQPY